MFVDFFVLIFVFNSISSHFNNISAHTLIALAHTLIALTHLNSNEKKHRLNGSNVNCAAYKTCDLLT